MSLESLYSQQWYRVAGLHPRLRPHVVIHRHVYRGVPWYVTQDPVSGRFHRFNAAAYRVIGQMDGRRSLAEIWERAVETLGDEVPTQDEIVQLLASLYRADLVETEDLPDIDELFERDRKRRRKERLQAAKAPLSIRIPLFDPDRLLAALEPIARLLFSRPGFLAWIGGVVTALVLATAHIEALVGDLSDRLLSTANLPVFTLAFIFVKALHEFGHGLAVKRWGGEVHETGIMLLVLFPVPYVDASAATGFPERHRRMIVGAAGMMFELVAASLALFVWLQSEPGLARALAYNVMVIAGVSTVLFNGNPLLRFDGYYILADAIGIPNLGQRANQYLGYLIQRYVFGIEDARSPASGASGEAAWFVFYAVASFVYRLVVMLGIALFIASRFFTLGLLLAAWAVIQSLLLPLGRQIRFLFTSPVLRERRRHAVTVSAAFAGIVLLLLAVLPAPYAVIGEGVVWVPEDAWIRAGIACRITGVRVAADAEVDAGQTVLDCEAPELVAEAAVVDAQIEALRRRRDLEAVRDRVLVRLTERELEHLEARRRDLRQRLDARSIRSPVTGRFVVEHPQDLPGRLVRKGERLAYVLPAGVTTTVRGVVALEDADIVRSSGRVEARLAHRLARIVPVGDVRVIPGASDRLPSPALSIEGGGRVVARPVPSPDGGEVLRAVEPFFQFEVRLPRLGTPSTLVGERVYLRFAGPDTPLLIQGYRALRQVLLRRLGL